MRSGRRVPAALLAIALCLAIGAALVVLFAPLQTSTAVTIGPGGTTTRTTTRSLLEEEGSGVAVFAIIPVAFVLVPTLLYLLRPRAFVPAATGAAVLLGVFVFLTGFSIGLFYVPALLALVIALVVAVAPVPASPSDGASEHRPPA